MRALTLFEFLVAVCSIFLLIGTFAGYAFTAVRVGREQALQNELVSIRMAVQHYQIVTHELPEALGDLMKKRLTTPEFAGTIFQRFLEPFRVDEEGFLLDPFMNRYGYDAEGGRVYSQTRGFETW